MRVYFASDFHLKFTKKEIDVEQNKKIISFLDSLIGNADLLILNGDIFTTNDVHYKIFRSLIRNNFLKRIFELFHPDFSLALGKLLSRSSRDRKSHPELERKKEEGLTEFAKKKLKDYDLVVLGHSHSPNMIKYENGYYANAGDWVAHQSYLKMIDGELELCEYS